MLNATSMTWFVWKWNFTLVHFFLNQSFKLIDVEKLHFVFYIFLVIVLEKIKVQVWIWILRQRSKFREKSRGKFNLHFPSKQVINNQHMKMRRWNMLMVFFWPLYSLCLSSFADPAAVMISPRDLPSLFRTSCDGGVAESQEIIPLLRVNTKVR